MRVDGRAGQKERVARTSQERETYLTTVEGVIGLHVVGRLLVILMVQVVA